MHCTAYTDHRNSMVNSKIIKSGRLKVSRISEKSKEQVIGRMNVTFEKGMNIEPQYNLSLISHNTTNVVYFGE